MKPNKLDTENGKLQFVYDSLEKGIWDKLKHELNEIDMNEMVR